MCRTSLKHLYRNKLVKTYVAHHAAYSGSKELAKRTVIEFMKLPQIVNMMEIKEHDQAWSISFLIKKTESGVSVTEKLTEELYKPVKKN